MAAFTIRPATPADAEALCALHKASVRALCLGVYTATEIDAWLRDREPQGFRHAMAEGGETMLVAECDGAVVCFASIKETVLFGLYVEPATGRGAGRVLLAAAEDEVRRRGAASCRCRRRSTPCPSIAGTASCARTAPPCGAAAAIWPCWT